MIDFFEQYGKIVGVVLLLLYYMPIIIAIKRRHQNIIGLGILNFFFGWTIIGWFGALIWSVSAQESVNKDPIKDKPTTSQELERLVHLKEEGHLSQKEFNNEKKNLLG